MRTDMTQAVAQLLVVSRVSREIAQRGEILETIEVAFHPYTAGPV